MFLNCFFICSFSSTRCQHRFKKLQKNILQNNSVYFICFLFNFTVNCALMLPKLFCFNKATRFIYLNCLSVN